MARWLCCKRYLSCPWNIPKFTIVVCVFWKTQRLQQEVSYFMTMVFISSIDLCVSVVVHPFHLLKKLKIFWFGHTSFCPSSCYYCIYWDIFQILSCITLDATKKRRHLGPSTTRQEDYVMEAQQPEPECQNEEDRWFAEHLNNGVS